MSREFGEYNGGGYFHHKIGGALNDLIDDAQYDLHKQFIPFFRELYEIAYAISSVEASDSSLSRTITEMINRLPKLKEEITILERSIQPYKDVAEDAIRKMTDAAKESK